MSMKLGRQLKEEFYANRLRNLSERMPFLAAKDIIDSLDYELKELISLSTLKRCEAGAKFFAIEGAQAQDYRERLLELGPNQYVIFGIRFRGLKKDQAYVSAWTNFTLQRAGQIEAIKQLAMTEFALFNPKWLVMALDPELELAGVKYHHDLLTVVGFIPHLQDKSYSDDDVHLELADDLNFYEHYRKEYDIFYQQCPQFKDEVSFESRSDLEISLNQGLLFKVMNDQQMIGLLAGKKVNRYGVKAVAIQEKFIYHRFRGKSLSSLVEGLFIQGLDPTEYSLITGTILANNRPSLYSSLKVGRKIVEADFYFEF